MILPPRDWALAAAWLLAAILAVPFALRVGDNLDGSTSVTGSESTAVDLSLRQQFHSPYSAIALLRVVGAPRVQESSGRELLARVIASLRSTAGVEGTTSYLDREEALFIGKDDSAIVIVGVPSARTAQQHTLAALRLATSTLQAELRHDHPTLDFRWTAEATVNADMRRLSSQETHEAELRVLPITLLLLLIAFRGLVAALLPIVCGAMTILLTLAIIALVSQWWPTSLIVVSIVAMIGLGLSIDYALLIVSRWRDSLQEGASTALAASHAAEHGGRAVVISGSAVAIGFASMLLVRVGEIRSIGLAGLLVTVIAVVVANTLLPVLLRALGPSIHTRPHEPNARLHGERRWRRWAGWVVRHPRLVLVAGALPLILLASQASHLRVDLPRGRWLPDTADSVRALHELESAGRGNFGQIIQVVLTLPEGTTVRDEAGWRATTHLARTLAREPRTRHVWSIATLGSMPLAGPEVIDRIPEAVRRTLVSSDGRQALVQLLPRDDVTAQDASALVRAIRRADPKVLTDLAGAVIQVGGAPAFNLDYADAIVSSMPIVGVSVILATLVVLSLAFRSVLIPLKAVALNLLSVAAAFGAVTLVFQDGHGATLLGLPRALDGCFPIIPLLVFCIVFGLSMDYEVFIVARMAEGKRKGLDDRSALIEGLVGSGRVVTYAASIMITVFSGFMLGSFVVIKILGFALAVAVFLDATVIRLAVGPALIQLAGRWNWWPGKGSPDRRV